MATSTRWTATETVAIARAHVPLLERHLVALADRQITAEFLRATRESATAVEAASSGQPVRLGHQKGSTEALGVVLVRVGRRVVGVREALMRVFPKRKDVQKSFGVGAVDASKSVENALAGLDAILESAEAYPTETAGAGILERDLVLLRELRISVLTADASQEDAKSSKKIGTTIRDGIVNDLVRRIDRTLAAVAMEFAEDLATLETFYAPLPSKQKKEKM